MPYGFAHVAFHRAHRTSRTYRQTIRALSRIPEVSALSPDGHGDRTAELAMDIAVELGISPKDQRDLEYAAQMHDLGRITLNQPSILRMGFTDEDIARWGARDGGRGRLPLRRCRARPEATRAVTAAPASRRIPIFRWAPRSSRRPRPTTTRRRSSASCRSKRWKCCTGVRHMTTTQTWWQRSVRYSSETRSSADQPSLALPA